ncbi:MAG TPA: LysR substrate-binding domain-containing protein [Pseudonocardiaceae bacterium]|nr:LysR substrate-binding domain-containing protein [Pseudonocardiaceae bacterium]
MLDVRRLRLLRELALRGTIAAVADALAFSPSAVSQQLSALEKEAGVALLERSGRSVVLTPAARGLVAHAEVVIERLEVAEAELASAREGLSGPVRIGAFPSATRTILPGALRALGAAHPGLTPMVFEVDPADVGDALRAGELEVALVHDYDFVPFPAEPGIVDEALCAEDMYLASVQGVESLAAGRESPWIVASPGTRCHAMTIRACEAAGFTPDVRHRIDDFDTVLAFVAAGEGVALVPELGALGPPAGVRLSRVELCRRTRIAFRGGAGRHPAVRAAIAALREALPGGLG